MNLNIPASDAIEIFDKRLSEIDSTSFDSTAWKARTSNDCKSIFSLGSFRWLQVESLKFETFISKDKEEALRNGKNTARQLIKSFIEDIQVYSQIEDAKFAREQDNYKIKYGELLKEWNDLVPVYNKAIEEKSKVEVEAAQALAEIETIKERTIPIEDVTLFILFKAVHKLSIPKLIAFYATILAILGGVILIGTKLEENKSIRDQYDLRKEIEMLNGSLLQIQEKYLLQSNQVNLLSTKLDSVTAKSIIIKKDTLNK